MKIITVEEAFKISEIDLSVQDNPFNEQLGDKLPQSRLLDLTDQRLDVTFWTTFRSLSRIDIGSRTAAPRNFSA
jgi:hypothetical protein